MDADLTFGRGPGEAIERLEALQDALQDRLEAAMEEATLVVMADAQRNAPVDTGRLRADISQELERVGAQVVKGYVGSNVEYAPFQEIMNPYLRPALEANQERILELFRGAVRDAVDEVT